MKKVIYTILASLAFVACQNEDITTQNSGIDIDNSKIQLVQVIDGTQVLPMKARTADLNVNYALKFDSKAAYDSTLEQLEKMSNEERLAFAKKYGLQSLQELAQIADEELEKIGAEASSEVDFRTKYDEYKKKYEGILISNMYDSEDLSLYVPDGDNVSTYLVGKISVVVIGNQINDILLSQDLSDSDKAVFTPKIQSRASGDLNGFQVKNGSKKTTCSLSLGADTFVTVHVGFQKKMWYGWKRDDHRDLYYHIDLSNFTYNYWVNGNRQVNIGCPDLYVFKSTGKIDYKTGYLTGGPRSLSGRIYVWTDMTAGSTTAKFNTAIIDNVLKRGEILPKCDRTAAYWTDIKLSL